MRLQIKEITDLYISKMEEIFEFRAVTQRAYIHFNSSVDHELKLNAKLIETGKIINQDQMKNKIINYESDFLPKFSFQHAVSIFEAWYFDVLRYLLTDNNRLNKKRKIEVGEIVSCGSLEELKNKIIEAELNEIRYRKPAEWFKYLGSFVNISAPVSEQIDKICEIKASRDILVHNEGICNQIYLSKAREMARTENNKKLCFDHTYVFESWKVLRETIETVGYEVSKKIDV